MSSTANAVQLSALVLVLLAPTVASGRVLAQDETPSYQLTAGGDGVCQLDCEGSRALEEKWADVWALTDLSPTIRLGLAGLGWNQQAWDNCFQCFRNNWIPTAKDCVISQYVGRNRNPFCPVTELMIWSDLKPSQKAAAASLGYTPELWDAGSPYSCCLASPLPKVPDQYVGLPIGPRE